MSKLTVLKNTSLIFALVVVVYLVANYTGPIKDEIMTMVTTPEASVKGTSTKRAEEISQKIKGDVVSQVGILQDRLLHVIFSDAVDEFSKLQKISKDFNEVSTFTKQQIDTVIQSKK